MKKMIRLVGKDIKTADISIDHVQEYRGKLSMMERQGWYQQDSRQNFRDEKYNIFSEKYIGGIHRRVGSTEEKITEPDDTAIETVQNETQREKAK